MTVPLGGTNASNQHFAKSLRFNEKTETQKNEWHNQLLAEDSMDTTNRQQMTASQLRRAELRSMRQSLRRGTSGSNSAGDISVGSVVLDDGSSLQVSEVINLYRKNQERLVKSNKQVVQTLKKLEGKMSRQDDILSHMQSPSFQTPGIANLEQLRQLQEDEIEVNSVNENRGRYIRNDSFDDSTSTAIVTRNVGSVAESMNSFTLNSPMLRAHERILEEGQGDWTIDAAQGSSYNSNTFKNRNSSSRRPGSTRHARNTKKKVWMPPSPGRMRKKRGATDSDLGSTDVKQQLSGIKVQQKRNNQLLRLLTDGANQAKPETMELLALAENNAVLAKHIEDSVEEKSRAEFELRLEQERLKEMDAQFAEMVDICKEEEKGRKLAEEKVRGLEDELKKLERSNLKNLGNSQRESTNTKILQRKLEGLLITKSNLEKEAKDWQANAERTTEKMSIMAEELKELRSQVDTLRSENESLATKLENSTKINSRYESDNKNLIMQVQSARKEMNELAGLQASINNVTTGQKLSMERMKHFSGEQDKLEALAAQQREELKASRKEVNRLKEIVSEERKLSRDLNDTASEARKALIEMSEKINSDKITIEELQSKSKNLAEQLQIVKRENKDKIENLQRQLSDAKRRQSKSQMAVSSINNANIALREQVVELENRLHESKRAHQHLLNTLNEL